MYLGFPPTSEICLPVSFNKICYSVSSQLTQVHRQLWMFPSNSQSPALSTRVSYSLSENILWYYRCFLSFQQGQPRNEGELTLWERNSQ